MPLPDGVTTSGKFNQQGTKVTLGYTCAHDYDPGPGEVEAPAYFARIAKGGGSHVDVWAQDVGHLTNTLSIFGVTVPADELADLSQLAASIDCG